MHISHTLFGQMAGILAVLQAIPYIISILRGRTRPSRSSYAIWTVIELIGMISYLSAGASTTKWTPIALTFNALVIFSLTWKRGMGGHSKLDVFCLLAATAAILLWVTSKKPALAVYVCVVAGAIGYIPTIKKAYQWPNTENTLSWCMFTGTTILNVCALTTLSPVIAIPPILGLAASLSMTCLLIFPRWKYKGAIRRYSAPPLNA